MNCDQILRIYGTDYKNMTAELLEKSGLHELIGDRNRKIGIKPNLVTPSPAEYGATTHPEVVSAIYWHTTGKPDMTLMEKIIYLADYIEPTRSFDGVEDLRATAYKDLDLTLLHAFDMVLEELIREKKRLCDETPAARAFLAERLGVQ